MMTANEYKEPEWDQRDSWTYMKKHTGFKLFNNALPTVGVS